MHVCYGYSKYKTILIFKWFSTFIINVLLHCRFFLVLLLSFKKWIKFKLNKCMSHHVTLTYNIIDTASINDTIY